MLYIFYVLPRAASWERPRLLRRGAAPQALAADPPLFPCELAREALRLACLPRPQAPPDEGAFDEDGDDFDPDQDSFEETERFMLANIDEGAVGDVAGRGR